MRDLRGRFSVNSGIHKNDGILDEHGMIQADFNGFRRRILIEINRQDEEGEGETSCIYLEDVLRHWPGECEFLQGCRKASNGLEHTVSRLTTGGTNFRPSHEPHAHVPEMYTMKDTPVKAFCPFEFSESTCDAFEHNQDTGVRPANLSPVEHCAVMPGVRHTCGLIGGDLET